MTMVDITGYGTGLPDSVHPIQFSDLVGTAITQVQLAPTLTNGKRHKVYGLMFSTDTAGHYELYIGNTKVWGTYQVASGNVSMPSIWPFYLDTGVPNSGVFLTKPAGAKIDGTVFVATNADPVALTYNVGTLPTQYTAWDPAFFLPIPAGSTYTSFQLGGDSTPGIHAGNTAVPDQNYFVYTTNSDPVRSVWIPGSGTRISGTVAAPTPSFHMPNSLTIPDDGSNSPTTIMNTDVNQTLWLNSTARPTAGTDIFGYIASKGNSPIGSTHGGSYTAGGYITMSELNNGVIAHALALNVYAEKYLHKSGGGFTMPAWVADASYLSIYTGNTTQPLLVMGAHLAIPTATTAASLGITSAYGLAIFNALQKYGAYVVDDTFWDAYALAALSDAYTALQGATQVTEIASMMAALQIVTTPKTVVQFTSGSGSWVCPPGVNVVQVECIGGGGGGRTNGTNGAGGGGAGAYAKCNDYLVPGTAYTYSIGAGGGIGTAGGDTSWRGGVCLAKGGSSGTAGTAGGAGGLASGSTGQFTVNGGTGGAGVSSGTNQAGGGGGASPDSGGLGTYTGSAAALDVGGNGGSNGGGTDPGSGHGGNGSAHATTAANGQIPGGGGGGGGNLSGVSGSGASGMVRITYFNPPTAS